MVKYYGKTKINNFQKAASDPVLLDIMHLVYLDLGSPVEAEKMLIELEKIEKEVRTIQDKDTIKINKEKTK